jgi:hypothetical protein
MPRPTVVTAGNGTFDHAWSRRATDWICMAYRASQWTLAGTAQCLYL